MIDPSVAIQSIAERPVLDEQAVTQLEVAGHVAHHLTPCRLNIEECCHRRPTPVPDADGRVLVGHDIMDDDLRIRHYGKKVADVLPQAVAARFRLPAVEHVLAGYLIDDLEFFLTDHLGDVTPHYFFRTLNTHVCLLVQLVKCVGAGRIEPPAPTQDF